MKEQELMVRIVRQPKEYGRAKIGEISVNEIDYPHWSYISGGYGARFGFSSIYGYIPYSKAMGLVDCSGNHNYGYNNVKVCIPASLNKEGNFKEGYDYLVKHASGVKGMSSISCNRPEGWKPCTKTILGILAEQKDSKMVRQELRNKIGRKYRADGIGFENKTICGAIKNLYKQGKIDRVFEELPDYSHRVEVLVLISETN